MRYEGEGGVNSNGGREAGSGKRDFYTVIALLVMVFVVAGAMFAVPAWSQDKDGKKSEKEKRTQSSSTRTENNRSTKDSTRTQQVGAQQVDAQAAGDDPRITKTDDPDPVQE